MVLPVESENAEWTVESERMDIDDETTDPVGEGERFRANDSLRR